MRAPSKTKESLNKVLPLRWSFGSKDRRKPEQVPLPVQNPAPVELVQYLESGRRPRCTKEPIATLMSESRSKKEAAGGRNTANVRSSSAGSLSCVGKTEEEQPYPQVPEGQRRPLEKTASLKRNKGGQSKEQSIVNISMSSSSNTLTRRKDARRQNSKSSQDTETKQSSGTGVHPSYSTPSLQDGTLRRQKGDKANQDQQGATDENSKTKKEEVQKGHDGLFSFLKGNFLKKEKDPKKSKEGDSGKGRDEEGGRRTLSRASLSNGAAGGRTAINEGKSKSSGHQVDGLANGKPGRAAGDIKRSQSSSNIPTKAEQSMRRTASLHRNGMSTAPSRSAATDKPSYGTLPRNRYSTTSLGRKRTVPESSF